jgi:hypothetical protein
MQVVKRTGELEEISFDKITKRIRDLCFGLLNVEPLLIAKETVGGIYDKIKTTELDMLSAEIVLQNHKFIQNIIILVDVFL